MPCTDLRGSAVSLRQRIAPTSEKRTRVRRLCQSIRQPGSLDGHRRLRAMLWNFSAGLGQPGLQELDWEMVFRRHVPTMKFFPQSRSLQNPFQYIFSSIVQQSWLLFQLPTPGSSGSLTGHIHERIRLMLSGNIDALWAKATAIEHFHNNLFSNSKFLDAAEPGVFAKLEAILGPQLQADQPHPALQHHLQQQQQQQQNYRQPYQQQPYQSKYQGQAKKYPSGGAPNAKFGNYAKPAASQPNAESQSTATPTTESAMNVEDADQAPVAKPAKVSVRIKQPKIDFARLVDEKVGIPVIAREFSSLPINFERGHEVSNLRLVLNRYREWANELFGAGTFAEKLTIIETIGQTERAKDYMRALRLKSRPQESDDEEEGESALFRIRKDDSSDEENIAAEESFRKAVQNIKDTPLNDGLGKRRASGLHERVDRPVDDADDDDKHADALHEFIADDDEEESTAESSADEDTNTKNTANDSEESEESEDEHRLTIVDD
eukprot:m.432887 g.432887  ORF g.432887 m.432887 type:complete len:492 (+) comp56757_c0_seq4:1208-2683(+)